MEKMNSDKGVKIIIDTDCGVDDALALMLAFSRTDLCKVIAITCCYGNTDANNVCQNVLRICQVCNIKQLDIYRGCHCPLVSPIEGDDFFGKDGLNDTSEIFPIADLKIKDEHAVQALVRLSKQFPNEITLIAIGPLTNLAMAQRLDPLFLSNFKEVIIMGGNIYGLGNITVAAEFNFYCDPEAAYIIMQENANITLIPWETCQKHEMKRKWFYEWIKESSRKGYMIRKITPALVRYADANQFNTIGDADVLAVAAAIYPQSVTEYIRKHVAVELRGELTRGQAVVEKRMMESIENEKQGETKKIITAFNDEILEKLRNDLIS